MNTSAKWYKLGSAWFVVLSETSNSVVNGGKYWLSGNAIPVEIKTWDCKAHYSNVVRLRFIVAALISFQFNFPSILTKWTLRGRFGILVPRLRYVEYACVSRSARVHCITHVARRGTWARDLVLGGTVLSTCVIFLLHFQFYPFSIKHSFPCCVLG